MVVGTVVTVLSAIMPALRGGRVSPLAAMRDSAVEHVGSSRKRMVIGLIFAARMLPSLLFAADKLKNADCLDCHTDPANKKVVNGHAVPMALFPTNGFAKSVHSSLDCIDCHDGIKEMQHDKNVPPPNCTGCHDKEGKDYATSIHGMSHSMGASGAAPKAKTPLGTKSPSSSAPSTA